MAKYNIKYYIGIDLGDINNEICVLDYNGDILEKATIENTVSGFNTYFDRFDSPREVKIAIETGTHSPWISQLLEARGFRVLVGNTRKLRAIWDSDEKTDERDAEMLARILRFDPKLLHPIRHRSRSAHMDLAIIKGRDALVRCRTSLINFVRGSCKTAGERLPSCSAETFGKVAIDNIPEDLVAATIPCIDTIRELTQKIRQFDSKIEALCKEAYPETMIFREIKGVGPITSLAYLLTLEDHSRFQKSRNVGPYLGLIPKRDQSGSTDKPLPITKAGNTYLRRLLVGSAQYILGPFGPDCELKRYGERISSRGGKIAKRKATVAVARKLAVLMHNLWKNGTVYEPFYSDYLKAA